ncbi:MAG: hypothetical protein ACK5FU_03920, partial [Bacteroidota bacterium]
GGYFSIIGDSSRNQIAEVGATTGLVTSKFNNGGFNGAVFSLTKNNNNIYAGGEFSNYGPSRNYGIMTDTANGIIVNQPASVSQPNSTVFVSIPDGNGGWFIGGDFSQVGDSARQRVAHINAQGRVSSWRVRNCNGQVRALLLDGNRLFIGGSFTVIGDSARNRIAVVNALTGVVEVDFKHRNFNSQVNVIKKVANTLYMGGNFTRYINNKTYAAEMDMAGIVNPLFPRTNGEVRKVISDGNGGWYVAGNFSMIGDSTRSRVAHVNASGRVSSWNPNVNNAVNALELSNGVLYLGGEFTTVGGQTRNRIAAVDAITGVLKSWNPNLNDAVFTLKIVNNQLYVGGFFTTIGALTRFRLASFDTASAVATAWNPSPNGPIFDIELVNNNIFVGGDFTNISGVSRSRGASFNISSGSINSWNPNANAAIRALKVLGDKIFIGGDFTWVGITPNINRTYLAALDTITGNPRTGFNSVTNSSVYEISALNDKILVGGFFSVIGGANQSNIALLDTSTGNFVNTWRASANNLVRSIEVSGTRIFAGGTYTEIGEDRVRDYAIALDINTLAPKPWNPSLNSAAYAIEHREGLIYIGGQFSQVNTNATLLNRGYAVAFDTLTGTCVTAFNAGLNNQVLTLNLSGDKLYLGGSFTTAGGQTRNRAAAFDLRTNTITPFNPNVNSTVWAINQTGSKVFLGGDFTNLGGRNKPHVAAVDTSLGIQDLRWDLTSNSTVFTISSQGPNLYVGNQATFYKERFRAAAFERSTGILTSFNPSTNGTVWSMQMSNGGDSLYIAGDFSNLNNSQGSAVNRNYLAKVDATFGVPSAWSPTGFNNVLRSLAISGNKLYVGGHFTTSSGQTRNRMMAFDTL